jgi:hypothetical protein
LNDNPVKAIIETALRDLMALGVTAENAAMFLALQGLIRVRDKEHLETLCLEAHDAIEEAERAVSH